MRISSAVSALALCAVFVLEAGRARAQAPTCPGADAGGAARALTEGDHAADRAAAAGRRHHADEAARAWAEALDAYDRACADGADEALERRAIPLFRLGRVVDAAVSLDAFLSIHPMDTLAPEVARRVTANRRVIERSVATLTVTTDPPGAEIRVDGAPRGVGPALRVRVLAASRVTLEVVAGGYEAHQVSTTYEAGEHDVAVHLRPVLVMSPEATSTEPSRTSASGPGGSGARSPGLGILIAGIVTGALALLSGALATALVLESEGIGSVVVIGDPGDAGVVATGLYIGSGVAGLASVTLFIVHAVQGSPSDRAWACGPLGIGAACAGRF